MNDEEIEVAGVGPIRIKRLRRAVRITCRMKEGGLVASVPFCLRLDEIAQALRRMAPRLADLQKRGAVRPIGWDYRISTELLQLSVVRGAGPSFVVERRPGVVRLICPSETDWTDTARQDWLRGRIEAELRNQSRQLLPPRLEALSRRWSLPYERLTVRGSRSRWGSCSSARHISLSYFLLRLPVRLVDYVLLHELAHTREMNHGPAFWALLNRMTDGKALALRRELRSHRMD